MMRATVKEKCINAIDNLREELDKAERNLKSEDISPETMIRVTLHCLSWGSANSSNYLEDAIATLEQQRERQATVPLLNTSQTQEEPITLNWQRRSFINEGDRGRGVKHVSASKGLVFTVKDYANVPTCETPYIFSYSYEIEDSNGQIKTGQCCSVTKGLLICEEFANTSKHLKKMPGKQESTFFIWENIVGSNLETELEAKEAFYKGWKLVCVQRIEGTYEDINKKFNWFILEFPPFDKLRKKIYEGYSPDLDKGIQIAENIFLQHIFDNQ